MRADGTQEPPLEVSASAPVTAAKRLSLRTRSEMTPLTNVTLHSPRARTVSQGFEGILDRENETPDGNTGYS